MSERVDDNRSDISNVVSEEQESSIISSRNGTEGINNSEELKSEEHTSVDVNNRDEHNKQENLVSSSTQQESEREKREKKENADSSHESELSSISEVGETIRRNDAEASENDKGEDILQSEEQQIVTEKTKLIEPTVNILQPSTPLGESHKEKSEEIDDKDNTGGEVTHTDANTFQYRSSESVEVITNKPDEMEMTTKPPSQYIEKEIGEIDSTKNQDNDEQSNSIIPLINKNNEEDGVSIPSTRNVMESGSFVSRNEQIIEEKDDKHITDDTTINPSENGLKGYGEMPNDSIKSVTITESPLRDVEQMIEPIDGKGNEKNNIIGEPQESTTEIRKQMDGPISNVNIPEELHPVAEGSKLEEAKERSMDDADKGTITEDITVVEDPNGIGEHQNLKEVHEQASELNTYNSLDGRTNVEVKEMLDENPGSIPNDRITTEHIELDKEKEIHEPNELDAHNGEQEEMIRNEVSDNRMDEQISRDNETRQLNQDHESDSKDEIIDKREMENLEENPNSSSDSLENPEGKEKGKIEHTHSSEELDSVRDETYKYKGIENQITETEIESVEQQDTNIPGNSKETEVDNSRADMEEEKDVKIKQIITEESEEELEISKDTTTSHSEKPNIEEQSVNIVDSKNEINVQIEKNVQNEQNEGDPIILLEEQNKNIAILENQKNEYNNPSQLSHKERTLLEVDDLEGSMDTDCLTSELNKNKCDSIQIIPEASNTDNKLNKDITENKDDFSEIEKSVGEIHENGKDLLNKESAESDDVPVQNKIEHDSENAGVIDQYEYRTDYEENEKVNFVGLPGKPEEERSDVTRGSVPGSVDAFEKKLHEPLDSNEKNKEKLNVSKEIEYPVGLDILGIDSESSDSVTIYKKPTDTFVENVHVLSRDIKSLFENEKTVGLNEQKKETEKNIAGGMIDVLNNKNIDDDQSVRLSTSLYHKGLDDDQSGRLSTALYDKGLDDDQHYLHDNSYNNNINNIKNEVQCKENCGRNGNVSSFVDTTTLRDVKQNKEHTEETKLIENTKIDNTEVDDGVDITSDNRSSFISVDNYDEKKKETIINEKKNDPKPSRKEEKDVKHDDSENDNNNLSSNIKIKERIENIYNYIKKLFNLTDINNYTEKKDMPRYNLNNFINTKSYTLFENSKESEYHGNELLQSENIPEHHNKSNNIKVSSNLDNNYYRYVNKILEDIINLSKKKKKSINDTSFEYCESILRHSISSSSIYKDELKYLCFSILYYCLIYFDNTSEYYNCITNEFNNTLYIMFQTDMTSMIYNIYK